MGNCATKPPEAAADNRINDQMKKEAKTQSETMKILLLGTGESGKSTVFKQLRIIHQSGYSEEEKQGFLITVHNNCIQNMKDLLTATTKFGGRFSPEDEEGVKAILVCSNQQPLTPDLVATMKKLWASELIQNVFSRRSQFQLGDSAEYYFKDLDRLIAPGYLPSDQDILRTRVRTSGIVEMSFDVDRIPFKIFDVGGQRNERRKWIHCFDNVQAVLFVVAMSEYDQVLYEDESQNRMKEALSLFAEICNSRYFKSTSMILFLNKRDLFEMKIKRVSLDVCFPEYEGGCDYEVACAFLIDQFKSLNYSSTSKQVYIHVTCATDTDNIRFVFLSVKDIMMTQNLRGNGFI
eukprot:c4844_g1_i1.p1 GENE.c4844_g1_i1~~c4844_g1_i1.p1  ORF type:complete len:349 (+),score=60.89 c4844_g1_i1:267-1313(+)